MDLHMLVQVRFLGKAEVASLVPALVWLLVCVDPQMVEEVVPFSEHFAAVFVLHWNSLMILLEFGLLNSKII